MIAPEDESAILELTERYGATRVLLFGSCAEPDREAHDIDLAVEGIPPARFFEFYGELLFRLSKPVDLVDLSSHSRFTGLIRRDGVPLHG
jgi:predicted nucleotidyltransferase